MRMTVCFTAILFVRLTMVRFSRTCCGFNNVLLCGKWTLPRANGTPCQSSSSTSHHQSCKLCATFFWSESLSRNIWGSYITSSLNWSKQTVEVKKKGNKILGVLQRNLASYRERSYFTLVRPMCEYDAVAWSPYTQKDITCVEFRSASRSGYPVTSPPRNVYLKTSVWKEFFRFKFTMKFKGVSFKWQYEPTFIRKAVGF